MSNKPKKIGVKTEFQDPKTGRFIPGNPGGGRPPGSLSLISILKEELQKVPKDQQESYAHALVRRMLKSSIIDGNDQQIKLIWNYIEGMPKQSVDMTSGGEKMHTLDITGLLKKSYGDDKETKDTA